MSKSMPRSDVTYSAMEIVNTLLNARIVGNRLGQIGKPGKILQKEIFPEHRWAMRLTTRWLFYHV